MMFSRITYRAYKQFVSTYDKNYNWGTLKMNRVHKKKWNEPIKVNINNKSKNQKII